MKIKSSQNIRLILFAIIILAFALRLPGVWFGYPWLKHYDEVGEIVPCALQLLDFQQSHGVAKITHNGPLLKYLMAFIFAVWGIVGSIFTPLSTIVEHWKTTTSALILGRIIVGVLPGTLIVWLVYLVGRNFRNATTGLAAAFITAIAFKLVEFSHYATSDSAAALLVLCILLFSLRFYENGKLKYLRLAALTWAAAVAVKLSAAPALVIPFTAVLMKNHFKGADWLKSLLHLALFSPLFLLIFHLPYLRHPLEFIKLVLNTLLVQTFFFKKGFFWYFNPSGYSATDLPLAGIGWMLLVLCLSGMIISLFAPNRKKWIILSFPVVFYLILGTAQAKETRYILPMLPILCLWGGVAFIWIQKLLSQLLIKRIKAALLFAFLAVFTYSNIYHSILYDLQAANGNTLLDLSRELSQILKDDTNWTKFGATPTNDAALPGKFIVLTVLGTAKERHSAKTIRSLKSRLFNIELLVEPHQEDDPNLPHSWTESPTDSILNGFGIEYIVFDEYLYRKIIETADYRIRYLDDFQRARAALEYLQDNCIVVAQFQPCYKQNWGEGYAGRQPAVWIYQYNPQTPILEQDNN